MLGKGAKRKLDEDEEGLEGKALAGPHHAAAATPGASASAALSSPGGPEGPCKGVSYTLQRQTIFNISLMKLYSQRALSEPSLQRRVLINNMLRRIQEELKQEGALRPLLFPPPPPPTADHLLDEGFRQASSSPTPTPAPPNASFGVLAATAATAGSALVQGSPANGLTLQPPPQVCLTPASLLEEDTGAFGALPPPPAPSLVPSSPSSSSPASPASSTSPLLLGAPCRPFRDSFSSALDEIEELCPTAAAVAAHMTTSLSPSPLSLSSPPSSLSQPTPSAPAPPHLVPSLALSAPEPKDCGGSGPKAGGPKPDPVPVPMDTLPPAELDMNSAPSSCNPAPPSCASSSSSGFLTDLALDDILFADIDTSMYDFDPCTTSAAGGGASKLTSVVTADDLLKTLSSPGGVTPNQPFKMDLTELDHIMEVLVGS